MERKFSDKQVEIIKILLSKGYSDKAIRDMLLIKYGQKVSSIHLQTIKKGVAYLEVREDLNESIFAKYPAIKIADISEDIHEIKWALANGYCESEIIKVFNISEKRMLSIKMLYAPFINISPEFNDAIRSQYPRKKKANIDRKMVIEIKKQYVLSNGKAGISEIGDFFKIDKATVSTIINLKTYNNYGISYNQKITAIKNKIAKEKKNRETLKIKRNKNRSKIIVLQNEKKHISELIIEKRKELIEMNL